MKTFIPLILVSVLLVSACDSATDNKAAAVKTDDKAAVAKTDDKVTVTTPAETSPAVLSYACESGETIAASYPSADSATVKYKGSDYEMKVAVSGSGARYVGGEMEWWAKGSGAESEGTLFGHNADGSTGDVMETCKAS